MTRRRFPHPGAERAQWQLGYVAGLWSALAVVLAVWVWFANT